MTKIIYQNKDSSLLPLVIGIVAVILTGITVFNFLASHTKNQSLKEAAKVAVANEFPHPNSSSFRNLYVEPRTIVGSVCGEIKGRNAVGKDFDYIWFYFKEPIADGKPFISIARETRDFEYFSKACLDHIATVKGH